MIIEGQVIGKWKGYRRRKEIEEGEDRRGKRRKEIERERVTREKIKEGKGSQGRTGRELLPP